MFYLKNMDEREFYKQKNWLEKQVRRGLSLRQISELANCSHMTIYRWMKKLKVKVNGLDKESEMRSLLFNQDDKQVSREEIKERLKRRFTVKQRKKKIGAVQDTGLKNVDYTADDEMDEIMVLFEGHY